MLQAVGRRSFGIVAALLLLAAVPFCVYAAEETLLLDDFEGVSEWSQSGWADADVDPDWIVRYVPRIRPNMGLDEGERALVATVHFKPGDYSQGVILHSRADDWSEWKEFAVELKLNQEIEGLNVRAKLIIFPDDRWTEQSSAYAVTLVPGEWVTLRVPIQEIAEGYWSAEMALEHFKRIKADAIKVDASKIPEHSEPVQVVIARPRLER